METIGKKAYFVLALFMCVFMFVVGIKYQEFHDSKIKRNRLIADMSQYSAIYHKISGENSDIDWK